MASGIIKWKDWPAYKERVLKQLRRATRITAKDLAVTINARDDDPPPIRRKR